MAWRRRAKIPAKSGPCGRDIEAARLLLRLTRDNLAHTVQLSPRMMRWAEEDPRRVDQVHLDAIVRGLEARGALFLGPGLVRHVDGRQAPTRAAVGKLKGARLRRGRNAVGMSLVELSSEAGLGVGTIQRLEAAGELKPTASVYAVVGALQLAGFRFAPNHGDRRIGERRKRLRPWEKDLPIEWLGVGLHVGVSELDLDSLD